MIKRLAAGLVPLALVGLAACSGQSEQEMRDAGYVDCSNWEGSLGIDEQAECIENGELVRYWDTSYGTSLRKAKEYAESIQ